MSERAKIIIAMWSAYAVAVTAVALTKSGNAESLGIVAAIVLGIVTVRLFR